MPLDNSGIDGFGAWAPNQPASDCYASAEGCCAVLQMHEFRASANDHSVATDVEGAWAAIPCDTNMSDIKFCICMGEQASAPMTVEEAKAMITQAKASGALRF